MQNRIEAVLETYAAAKNRHDVDAALACCHDDASYETAGMPGRVAGKPALRAFYSQLFQLLPDYRAEFHGRAIDGDVAVVWGRFGGTVGDRRIDLPVTFVCTFRDGLLASDVGYFDWSSFLAQAGPPLRATAEAPAGRLAAAAAWVDRFAAFWQAPSPERVPDLVHAHTVSLYPGMAEPTDRDGVVAWFRMTLAMMPDLRLEVLRWAATGDDILIEWRATATLRGARTTWDGVDRFRLAGDKAIEGRVYFDTMRVLGGPPAVLATPAAIAS